MVQTLKTFKLSNLYVHLSDLGSPLIPKPRSTIVSRIVDRYLYGQKTQKLKGNEIVVLLTSLLKQNDLN